jgi:hypothetical protein
MKSGLIHFLVGIGMTLVVQSADLPGHPAFFASSSSVIAWLLVVVGSTGAARV